MKLFERREFADLRDRDSGAVFEGLVFRRCSFEGCVLSLARDPRLRSRASTVILENCDAKACTIHTAIIEDATVDGLKTQGLFQVWGAVLRHVVLKGKLGRLMLSSALLPVVSGVWTQADQRAYDDANAEYLASVDWSLDISGVEAEELDIRGIPARLVRRDPETQAVVTRQKAMSGEWRNLDLSGTHWATSIQSLLDLGLEDKVLVAAKRSKRFHDLLGGIKKLRDAGIAEPS